MLKLRNQYEAYFKEIQVDEQRVRVRSYDIVYPSFSGGNVTLRMNVGYSTLVVYDMIVRCIFSGKVQMTSLREIHDRERRT